MRPPRHDRAAFTLVQLLVVTGVAAFALGLLVPAVLHGRATALRTQCQGNLQRIGLALHAYHDTRASLPPGIVVGTAAPAVPPPPTGEASAFLPPCTGTLSFLLPYLGQQALFEQIPTEYLGGACTGPLWAYSTPPFDTENRNNTGLPAWAMAPCALLECPAAANHAPFDRSLDQSCGVIDAYLTASRTDGPPWGGNPTILPTPGGTNDTLLGSDFLPPTTPGFAGPNVADLAVTNYVPNGGTLGECKFDETLQSYVTRGPGTVPVPRGAPPPYADPANVPSMPLLTYVGPFGVNSHTRFGDLLDGSTNTLAFGETLGGQVFEDGSVDFRIARAAGVTFPGLVANQERPVGGAYSSNHAGVSNFLWCDGSVRPIRKFRLLAFDNLPAAWYVFQAAAGMHDGRPPDPELAAD